MKKLFNKLLLSYLLVLLIPLISLGMLSYWWIGNVFAKQVEQSYVVMLRELNNSMDEQLKELSDLSIQFSSAPWVKKVMYMQSTSFDYNRMDPIELSNHVEELKGYDLINDFINTVAIIFPRQQYIISSAGTDDATIFFNDVFRLEKVDYNQWKKIFEDSKGARILGPDILRHNNTTDKVYTYVQPIIALDQKPRGYFVTYIKEESIISKLKGFQISKDSSIYVLNEKGKEVVSLKGDKNSTMNLKEIDLLSENKSNNLVRINGNRYFVFYHISDLNHWTYISTIPYDVVMEKVNHIKNITTIMAFFLCIIGLYISYVLTARNYNPLLTIVNTMKKRFSYKESYNINEYDFLQKSITLLLGEEDILRKQTEHQKPFIRNTCFLKILNNSATELNGIKDILKVVDVTLPFQNFTVALFVLNSTGVINDELQEKTKGILSNIKASVYWAEISGNKKVAILNIEDINESKMIIIDLKKLVENELNINCTVGMGSFNSSIDKLYSCYEEACTAVDYRLINEDNSILFYEEVITFDSHYYYYPMDMELKILNGLRRGNYNDTADVIKEIISVNMDNSNISLSDGRCLFYDIFGTLLKSLNELKLYNVVTIERKNIRNIETLTEMKEYIFYVCQRICEVTSDSKVYSKDYFKIDVLKYIEENYNNPCISLDTLADSVNKSVSYISKFFKEQLGYSFVDFLNRKRINKAKELLNGQMTIIQIAMTVGYNSDVNFRRVFKKYEGVTPGEYIIANKQLEYNAENSYGNIEVKL